jgi:hypothetical protein
MEASLLSQKHPAVSQTHWVILSKKPPACPSWHPFGGELAAPQLSGRRRIVVSQR